MNIPSSKFSSAEILNGMSADSCYHTIDGQGLVHWHHTKGLTGDTLARSIRVHEFVEGVRKSESPAFNIEKTLIGSTLTKIFPLAKLFHDVVAIPNGDAPPKHEASEHAKAFGEVMRKLNAQNVPFSRDPMAKIGSYGLLEGELINTIITRLREATKRRSFTNAAEKSKRQVAKNVLSLTRYLKRQVETTPFLYAYRLDLGRAPTSANITPGQFSDLIDNFLLATEGDLPPGALVGHVLLREYLKETGYRYHAILLVDCQKIMHGPALVHGFEERWHAVTDGMGTFFNHANYPDDHRSHGAGPLHNWFSDATWVLLRAIKLMLTTDIYLRLQQDPSVENFSVGKFPPPLDKSTRATFTPLPWTSKPRPWEVN